MFVFLCVCFCSVSFTLFFETCVENFRRVVVVVMKCFLFVCLFVCVRELLIIRRS